MAAMPKRMTFPARAGAKNISPSFTSGCNTSTPIERASFSSTVNFSVLLKSFVIMAQRNSTG
jgi:hypothetical protein